MWRLGHQEYGLWKIAEWFILSSYMTTDALEKNLYQATSKISFKALSNASSPPCPLPALTQTGWILAWMVFLSHNHKTLSVYGLQVLQPEWGVIQSQFLTLFGLNTYSLSLRWLYIYNLTWLGCQFLWYELGYFSRPITETSQDLGDNVIFLVYCAITRNNHSDIVF